MLKAYWPGLVLARGWLSSFETALPATFITAVWGGVGFPMVLYLAALQAIPAEQYEAAKMDGANGRQLFWNITLPWLREAHVIVFSLAVISSFKTFDLIYTMTYGGPGRATQVLGTWMYFQCLPVLSRRLRRGHRLGDCRDHPGHGDPLHSAHVA